MQKVILPISKCIPGMTTAQPIVNMHTGATIIAKNQVLTAENLSNISKFVHTDIWVYLDSFDRVWNLPSKTIENYKKYGNALSSVLENIKPDSTNNTEAFEDIYTQITDEFKDHHVLVGCTDLIKKLDHTVYTHSLNVAFLSMLICKWTHASSDTLSHTVKAALLHDIGNINLAFDVTDPDTLSSEEYVEYQKHPIYSYNIVSKMKDLAPPITKGILAHHERCDGTGFPLKLTTHAINDVAKILAIADSFELLRKKHHIFDTLRILLTDQLTKFDTNKLLTFCHYIANYYIGVFVTLNTGEIGELVFINPLCIYKPIIKIKDQFINLYEENQLSIVEIS